MNEARRAYDLLRGYVNREFERLRGVEETYAERELNDSVDQPMTRVETTKTYTYERSPENITHARKVLGVTSEADFVEIRQAFDRLNKRADPSRFPAGSLEARQAGEIHKLVVWAYTVLSEGVDSTEKRFKSLELD